MCEWVHVTEATSQLLVKLYLGWSDIKEGSRRKEERGDKKRTPPQISLRPKPIRPGKSSRSLKCRRRACTRPPGTLLSAQSFRPVVTIWLKLPAETGENSGKKHYDIIINCLGWPCCYSRSKKVHCQVPPSIHTSISDTYPFRITEDRAYLSFTLDDLWFPN